MYFKEILWGALSVFVPLALLAGFHVLVGKSLGVQSDWYVLVAMLIGIALSYMRYRSNTRFDRDVQHLISLLNGCHLDDARAYLEARRFDERAKRAALGKENGGIVWGLLLSLEGDPVRALSRLEPAANARSKADLAPVRESIIGQLVWIHTQLGELESADGFLEELDGSKNLRVFTIAPELLLRARQGCHAEFTQLYESEFQKLSSGMPSVFADFVDALAAYVLYEQGDFRNSEQYWARVRNTDSPPIQCIGAHWDEFGRFVELQGKSSVGPLTLSSDEVSSASEEDLRFLGQKQR